MKKINNYKECLIEMKKLESQLNELSNQELNGVISYEEYKKRCGKIHKELKRLHDWREDTNILNPNEHLKEKLIVDYEKLHYDKVDRLMRGMDSDNVWIKKLTSKQEYVSYLFNYLYDLYISDFVNFEKVENMIKEKWKNDDLPIQERIEKNKGLLYEDVKFKNWIRF